MSFITCPNCGTSVSEGVLRCPACHADISATMRMPRQVGTWCGGCGSLVPEGLDACPSCGLPVNGGKASAAGTARSAVTATGGEEQAPVDELVPTETPQSIPRIESALPVDPADALNDQGMDALPHAPQILAFVLVAAAVLGLVVALITHPWNPDAYSVKATTETDTSKVGFPGVIETLSSQDRSAAPESSDAE